MNHGHHKISAAIFVGSLILGCAMILGAELTKPARYEYHSLPGMGNNSYLIFDNDTGRAAVVDPNTKNPTDALSK
jgi:hypothetical protein